VRYEQVETFDITMEVAKKIKVSMEEVPRPTALLQPRFGISVRMKLTLPKVGSWSPSRLPKIQSLIARVKTPRIGVFLMSLERY
jgi:hypothetical protein